MTHDEIKCNVNKLSQLYVTEKNKEKYIDELFILIYYHPRNFSITMKDEVLNDFRSTLYPKIIENIFSKYDKEKSSFFTFTCICLKNQAKVFLRELYLKNAIDESILNEIYNNESIKILDEDASLNINIDECNLNIKYEENDMQKMLTEWILKTDSLKTKKNYRKAIFILSCKLAYAFDEKMIKKIAEYIEIPESVFRYYISKINLEYSISTNAKKITNIKNQRDKYFVKKATANILLNCKNLSESGKIALKCSKKYSIQKYKKACKILETEKENISNRTIGRITGISRSMIDRIMVDISDILGYAPKVDNE